ncbi:MULTISPECIES: class I SAM-dependent methyltransferase [Glycomyces]|uniref:Methyltransferase domain-containing protein n=2 Tax=Glycomyces TaxID=58113 RepID=A0A9X3SZT9_9ACTN|nr:methyltransferase domain-containing protein [Glycomyces lechevalierae]MDA1387751.1 methyltransferase domain-containing protein [Glycomyces lechevalierae]MDR7337383.1 SAM-dependent methyltransferase [Glycomyces lechevalierae]
MPRDTAYHGALGDAFAAHSATGAYNAYIDRPAMLALAGDVAGQRLLDVGCGPGHYAAALVERGAEVVGVDGSAELIAHAKERVGDRAELRVHDLELPLDFAEDASFDTVLSALVVHHIRDRAGLLDEIFRVLKPGGRFLISTTHPAADWKHFGGSYFSEEWVDLHLTGDLPSIHFQRNTVEGFIGDLLEAGFSLEKLVEPRPVPELETVDPEAFARLNDRPSFLAARLRRP